MAVRIFVDPDFEGLTAEEAVALASVLSEWLRDQGIDAHPAVALDGTMARHVMSIIRNPRPHRLGSGHDAYAFALGDVLPGDGEAGPDPILMLVPSGTPFVTALQNENNMARWGAAMGTISTVWQMRGPQILWHELLHTLGAEDCYDVRNGDPICDLPNCLMQWAPTDTTVGRVPALCSKNIERVRAASL